MKSVGEKKKSARGKKKNAVERRRKKEGKLRRDVELRPRILVLSN